MKITEPKTPYNYADVSLSYPALNPVHSHLQLELKVTSQT